MKNFRSFSELAHSQHGGSVLRTTINSVSLKSSEFGSTLPEDAVLDVDYVAGVPKEGHEAYASVESFIHQFHRVVPISQQQADALKNATKMSQYRDVLTTEQYTALLRIIKSLAAEPERKVLYAPSAAVVGE